MDKKDECLKILKNLFFNDEGKIVSYIDFTSGYGDEWNGYTLEQYVKAFIELKDEINKEKIMSNYTLINIKGKKIKAFKTINYIWSCDYHERIIGKKVKYRIKFEPKLYDFIPTIVKIKGKEFYKSDIRNINQEYFSLIEI